MDALSITSSRELTSLSASELVQLTTTGEISASEVVESHIARIEQVNPQLNALVVQQYEQARAHAQAADRRRMQGDPLGPLHGVPLSVKECIDVAGTPSTFGFQSRAGHRAEQDDPHVAALRAAGAIVLGKTNVAQALLFVESDNPLYGRTNNPWNLDRSSGGSSGGEGAIIAVGGSALGLGTDIGGSVRFPAAFCGIASLKPTVGRADDPGRFSVPLGQRAIVSQIGVLARTAQDVALGAQVAYAASDSVPPMREWRDVALSRMRVAWFDDDGTMPPSPAVRRAVREAADALRRAGAQVTAWQPPQVPHAVDLFYPLLTADGGALMKAAFQRDPLDSRIATLLQLASSPPPVLALLKTLLRSTGQARLAEGLGSFGHVGTASYWRAAEQQLDYRSLFARALDSADGGPFDLILSPASPLPAFVHGASADLATAGGYTVLYNLLGYPAGVVPVTRVRADEELSLQPSKDRVVNSAYRCQLGSAGLPIGVQVAARPWREDRVLAAMATIELTARRSPDFPARPHI